MTTLEKILGDLDESGLIRLVQYDPDAAYQFRHVLTQEAAYGSLLKQDRRRLHKVVGLVLEREYANQLDEIAPILARHFDEADDVTRALVYSVRAADAAAARFANTEATMHYRRALAIAQRAQASGKQLIDLYLKHGRVLEISGQYVEALAAYVEMEMQALERDDRRMLLAALMARATVYAAPTVLNDAHTGDELAQRALALALELNDRASEAKAWWLRMMTHRFSEHVAAIEYGERSAQIAREMNLREQLAYALNDIFTSYLNMARADKALAVLNEAEQIWRELDNPNLLADALTSGGEVLYFMGRLDEGVAKLDESIQLNERTSNAWGQSYTRWILGAVALDHADYTGAITSFQMSLRFGAQAGFAISQIAAHGFLALIYSELGDYALGEREARKSIELAETLKPDWSGMGYAVIALCQFHNSLRNEALASLEIAKQHASLYDLSILVVEMIRSEIDLAGGEHELVVKRMDDAINLIHEYGLMIYMPQVLYYQGVALLGMGHVDEAVVQLAAAREQMDKLGTRRHLWRVQLAQAACEHQLSHVETASMLQSAASAEIDAIVHALPPNLRETFLLRVAEAKRNLSLPIE